MKTIDITISKTGEIEYKVEGIKGGACKDVTKFIDNLAGKVLSSEKTGEYCETEPVNRARYTGGNEG